MGEEIPRGSSRPDLADLASGSGWVATDVAARAVRVSPRTIRRYIDQGRLEAKPQGEGVRREWLVSVDSLHALLASRTAERQSPRIVRDEDADTNVAREADSIADVLREMAARLERRAEEAAELRVRLELTERSQSTLEEERRQVLRELEEERRKREAAEQKNEELLRKLEALQVESEEGAEEPTEPTEAPDAAASPGPNTQSPEEASERETAPEQPFTEEHDPTLRAGEEAPRQRRSLWRWILGGGG